MLGPNTQRGSGNTTENEKPRKEHTRLDGKETFISLARRHSQSQVAQRGNCSGAEPERRKGLHDAESYSPTMALEERPRALLPEATLNSQKGLHDAGS
ncbi:hypothetical protein H920_16731 [Fukomys damarensis]|uniref:Uncharacterized protein n=1 Tax=Fukomys damarensis TaxID=885580 RepID=A0A091CTU2_FUKDA|nr:hypothetical protein H920_16731 [Fukomys damarensis]